MSMTRKELEAVSAQLELLKPTIARMTSITPVEKITLHLLTGLADLVLAHMYHVLDREESEPRP